MKKGCASWSHRQRGRLPAVTRQRKQAPWIFALWHERYGAIGMAGGVIDAIDANRGFHCGLFLLCGDRQLCICWASFFPCCFEKRRGASLNPNKPNYRPPVCNCFLFRCSAEPEYGTDEEDEFTKDTIPSPERCVSLFLISVRRHRADAQATHTTLMRCSCLFA